MWELLSAEQRTLVLTRTEELGTGSVWLFYVTVAQHGGSTGGSLGPHDTQGPHTSQGPFFPFSPTALLAFPLCSVPHCCFTTVHSQSATELPNQLKGLSLTTS